MSFREALPLDPAGGPPFPRPHVLPNLQILAAPLKSNRLAQDQR